MATGKTKKGLPCVQIINIFKCFFVFKRDWKVFLLFLLILTVQTVLDFLNRWGLSSKMTLMTI